MQRQTITQRIRQHYNMLAPFYYALWGQHIHHGYWMDTDDQSSPARAQERLMEQLYALADNPPVENLLDIGCGFGGSLQWFARHSEAYGIGVTLSPVQCLVGRLNARRAGLQEHMTIHVADAEQPWAFPANSFDMVWSIECLEHIEHRSHVVCEAYRVLKPGSRMLVSSWLAGEQTTLEAINLRRAVQHGMLCAPFETAAEHIQRFQSAGFTEVQSYLVTANVLRTWDICLEMRDHPVLKGLSRILGEDVHAFTNSFPTLRQAYQNGAMEYGLFSARKPVS
jgi:tocopherol O-methyltransferase